MMSSGNAKNKCELIRGEAHKHGFDLIGIAPSRQLNEHKDNLISWLDRKMNADMSFLSRNLDKRFDPGSLLPGAKSVIVTGLNYFPSSLQGEADTPVISKYAYGKDYHSVIKEKLSSLLEYIITLYPSAKGIICVDSSPVLEKAWAHEAGLGWIGKNSLLINRGRGSFIFLGEIILDTELEYDTPIQDDNCGSCNLCKKACPTGAINENRTINAGKCISWLTVENKIEIPGELKGKLKNRIFGCDICQDVCPWNANLQPHNNPEFNIPDEVKRMSLEEWKNLSPDRFKKLFSRSPVIRTGYKKIANNIKCVAD